MVVLLCLISCVTSKLNYKLSEFHSVDPLSLVMPVALVMNARTISFAIFKGAHEGIILAFRTKGKLVSFTVLLVVLEATDIYNTFSDVRSLYKSAFPLIVVHHIVAVTLHSGIHKSAFVNFSIPNKQSSFAIHASFSEVNSIHEIV